jgi:sodium pump decarboxylase gamma subunit
MELIKEAALNTVLGMGTTFVVLIFLSLIISLFGTFLAGGLKLPKKAEPKKNEPEPAPEPEETVEKALEPAAAVAEGDDPALMAVISAAVAAYESSDVSPEVLAVIAAAIAASEEKTFTGTPSAKNFAARRIRKSRKHVA